MDTIVTTNGGVIKRITILTPHPQAFHYGRLALVLIALIVIAFALRAIFWQPNSN